MTEQDAEPAWEAAQAAFEARGEHWPTSTEPPELRWRRGVERVAYLTRTDPAGAWVATDRGRVRGAALALVREGVWGLSLLAVHPAAQSTGLGRRLLQAALGHAGGTRGQIILSSQDPRALRSYLRAGFTLLPAMAGFGVVRRAGLPAAEGVREATPADLELAAAVDRDVRGGAHGPDLEQVLNGGSHFHVVPDRGYVMHADGSPRVLAARDVDAARALLVTALAGAPVGIEAGVMFLTAHQSWALPVVLDAGLQLEPCGPTFVRGELGPMSPYIPTPAYL